ncbi:MAG: TonB-dependent receptor [Marinifilaceae bacterium]
MKKYLLLMFIISMNLFAFSQESVQLRVNRSNASIIEILNDIENQTDYRFTYDASSILVNSHTKITKGEYSLKSLLELISKEKSLKYLIVKKNIALKVKKYVTISGVITDAKTGETLIGANVFELNSRKGVMSNAYGFYSLRVLEGDIKVEFSFISYNRNIKEIKINKNIRLDVSLTSSVVEMKDVLVNGLLPNENISRMPMGKESISADFINSIVSIGGEPDIIKSLQTLSGVRAIADGSAQMSVRGGSYDQNLILLDEAPVYNPSHALGFFSVFNADAFKSTDMYKSYIPAKFGGRLSSVIDIRTKDGNKEKIGVQGGIGLLASRLTIDGPINENTSFLLAGRYSYVGHLLNAVNALNLSNDLSNNSDISFYDFNLKLSHKINANHRLYLSAYAGRDNFYYANIDEKSNMDWGNITSSLRWNAILSDKLFMNTSLIYSKYDYSYNLKDDSRNFDWTASLNDINLKCDLDYIIKENYNIKFGSELSTSDIEPGKISPRGGPSNSKKLTLKSQRAYLYAFYLDNNFSLSEALDFNLGIRFSNLDSRKTDQNEYGKSYSNLEPRFSMRLMINESTSIKASYTKTYQYLHLMSNSALGFPTDIWLPSNKYIKPQSSDQYSLGLYKNFADNSFESSVEVYYKKLDNVIDFIDNSNLFLNENIHEQILAGTGRAYGVDFSIKKIVGKTHFMANYSYSKTFKTIEGVNGGSEYPMIFDKPHAINLSVSHKIGNKWDFSASWNYTSGGTATLPAGRFVYKGISFLNYTSRNGYRLPSNHRLDLMVTYTKKHKYFESQWKVGIYNVYARHNMFALMVKPDTYDINRMTGKKMYIGSIMPTITYCFKF